MMHHIKFFKFSFRNLLLKFFELLSNIAAYYYLNICMCKKRSQIILEGLIVNNFTLNFTALYCCKLSSYCSIPQSDNK